MNFTRFLLMASLALLGGLQTAEAGDVQYTVGGGYVYFAGQQLKSLAPKTGYLIRFGAESGRRSIFRWQSNLSLLSSQDTTGFNDAGTTRNLSYQLVAGEFNLGVKLAFLAGVDRLPIQPYLGASGAVMAASFKFPENATVSATFPKTDAQNFYGYSIFVGVDVELGRDWGVCFHVEQSKVSGTVAQSAFNLDSNRVLVNVFVR